MKYQPKSVTSFSCRLKSINWRKNIQYTFKNQLLNKNRNRNCQQRRPCKCYLLRKVQKIKIMYKTRPLTITKHLLSLSSLCLNLTDLISKSQSTPSPVSINQILVISIIQLPSIFITKIQRSSLQRLRTQQMPVLPIMITISNFLFLANRILFHHPH